MVTIDDRERVEALNRYWDAVARGAAPPDEALDPSLMAEVLRVQGYALPFVAQLWQDLMARPIAGTVDPHGAVPPLSRTRPSAVTEVERAPAESSHARLHCRPGLRPLVAAVAAAIVLALGGVVVPHLQPATPISAQTVLDRAAARSAPPANVVVHQVFTDRSVTRGAVCTRTMDVWAQYDARGRVIAYNGRFRSCEIAEGLHDTATFKGYMPTQEMQLGRRHILIFWPQRGRPSVSIYVRHSSMREYEPPGVPLADWAQPLRDAQRAYGQAKRLLPSRLLDGYRVEVVQVKPTRYIVMTLYIDARDYHLRAVSTVFLDASYSSFRRLLRYERVPLSRVPAGVFTFKAPSGASVTVGP